MALSFADIKTRVLNHLRIPTSNATEGIKVEHLINEVYRDLMARYNWRWLLKRQTLNTVAKFSSGNATVTLGSTTVRLSATPAASLGSFTGRVILFASAASDSGAVYRISAHTAGTTELTLDAAFTNANIASGSYNVYQDSYNLATDCGRVSFVRRFGIREPLRLIGPMEMAELKSFDESEGKPLVAATYDYETTGDPTTARQLQVHPFPDLAYRLEAYYKQSGNLDLSGTTRPLVPDEYVQILIYGALARAYPVLLNDVERGTFYTNLFNEWLSLMLAQQREHEGNPQVVPRDHYRGFYSRRRSAGNTDLGSWFDRLPSDF